jgi:hypothetical protein
VDQFSAQPIAHKILVTKIMSKDTSLYPMKHHPETCDPDDIWRQVVRTQGGKPVEPEQIDLIIKAVIRQLDLGRDDILLDLCCGNGALTTYFFARCVGGLGVDYSEFLINIANQRFVTRDTEAYRLSDALHYLRDEAQPERFTKAMCYGAFPYFPPAAALEMLTLLNRRFLRVRQVFLGQLPDRARIGAFYDDREMPAGVEDDPGGQLGLWRTEEQMIDQARAAGWNARCTRMPDAFFSAHYRFDTVLTRP